MIILRNKEFARKDYDGYSESQKKIIKEERTKLAKEIRKKRAYGGKSLADEIDKIADDDLRKYVLNGEGKNKEFAPEEIEKRRNQRRKRLYEPSRENRDEIEDYLKKGKEKIKEKVGEKKPPLREVIKVKAEKLNIPYKKIGKYALGGTAIIGGTIGASKLIRARKEAKKRESIKKTILGEKK